MTGYEHLVVADSQHLNVSYCALSNQSEDEAPVRLCAVILVDAQVVPLGKCLKQGSKRSKEPLELRQLCLGKKLRVVVHLLA